MLQASPKSSSNPSRRESAPEGKGGGGIKVARIQKVHHKQHVLQRERCACVNMCIHIQYGLRI